MLMWLRPRGWGQASLVHTQDVVALLFGCTFVKVVAFER